MILIYGCHKADLNDTKNRNENWVYWVDSSTGKTSWIPISNNHSTVKNGSYTLFYKNGGIYEKGKLKNGKKIDTIYFYDLKQNLIKYKLVLPDTVKSYFVKNGLYKSYFQDGKIFEKGIVTNHKHGNKWTRYFENGKIDCIQNLENGTGINRWYFENGQISDSFDVVNNKTQGNIKIWYENGQIKEISDWNNGIQIGKYETYFKNGTQKQLINWINGKQDDKSASWYENGQQESIAFYKQGLRDGNTKQWFANGKMQLDAVYTAGKMNGKVIKYYDNGNVQTDGFYKNDKIYGICIWFDKSGKQIKKQSYDSGKLIREK